MIDRDRAARAGCCAIPAQGHRHDLRPVFRRAETKAKQQVDARVATPTTDRLRQQANRVVAPRDKTALPRLAACDLHRAAIARRPARSAHRHAKDVTAAA